MDLIWCGMFLIQFGLLYRNTWNKTLAVCVAQNTHTPTCSVKCIVSTLYISLGSLRLSTCRRYLSVICNDQICHGKIGKLQFDRCAVKFHGSSHSKICFKRSSRPAGCCHLTVTLQTNSSHHWQQVPPKQFSYFMKLTTIRHIGSCVWMARLLDSSISVRKQPKDKQSIYK